MPAGRGRLSTRPDRAPPAAARLADEKIADKLSELVDLHRNAEVTATDEASGGE